MNDAETLIGVLVENSLKNRWTLMTEGDRRCLPAIVSEASPIDLVHYDSDKSHSGRQYGYHLMWQALRPGGIFISDDIQDNLAFREFMERRGVSFAVTEYQGKYVGVARKA